MTTRKAPGAWGRGRGSALATAFVLALLLMLCLVPAAFATPKNADADSPGASESAPGHTGELPPTANAKKATPGAPTAPPDENPGTVSIPNNDSTSSDGTAESAPKDKTKVWEPNKPVGDKYDGPCTRHEDTDRKGRGHDWHQGVGVGHSGVKPSNEPSESVPPSDTPPPSEGETDTPSEPATETPSGEDTPTIPGEAPDDDPFLPFTPTQAPADAAAPAVVVTKQTAQEDEYLPYTGGDAGYLLLLALGCALTGGGLRRYDRKRLQSHRRVAR